MHGRSFACGIDLQLDMLGEELGIDPVTMRLRNARRAGEYTPTGSYVSSCGMTECIEKAALKSRWREKYGKLPRWRGIGIGINSVQTGFPLGIRGGSQAIIKFNELIIKEKDAINGTTRINFIYRNTTGRNRLCINCIIN
jgi:4-hydroxybenzoyl-CoA reductase subunit alpha